MNDQQPPPSPRKQVFDALQECYDPEIPVNVVDLGLIYEVKIIDDLGGGEDDPDDARMRHERNDFAERPKPRARSRGVKEADVRIVWEPAWTPERMSATARKRLGFQS